MPDLPSWTVDDVEAFLSHYALAARVDDATPLLGGAENLSLLLRVGEEQLVLRRYTYNPEGEIEWELQLVRHLSARGFPTPPVLADRAGALQRPFLGRPAALLQFVPGRDADPQSVEDARAVAAAAAELHLITGGLHLPYPRSHTDWARLEQLQADALRLTAPGLAEMAATARAFCEQFADRLAAVGSALPTGIIHHDLNPGNAIMDDAGQLVAVIDFGEAHEGELLLEVAGLLRMWATPHDWRGLKRGMPEALLAAYHARRPLSPAEWELLPDFLLFYALADAAGYVTGRLAYEPAGEAVPVCNAYQRFLALQRDQEWREELRPRSGWP